MAARVLPADLAERARAYAAGRGHAVFARPAATVVLLRDAPAGPDAYELRTGALRIGGLEAYVLRRHAGMPFAAGMHAFPGGGVDPRDTRHEIAWAGPDAAEWGRLLGCEPSAARGFVCAAVRETFEETGVLLAGPDGASTVDVRDERWEAARRDLVDRRLALTDLLDREGLLLRSDLLAPWAHWVTPRFERRRYDTWFFLAALPAGQHARAVSGEADATGWLAPAEAVRDADEGRRPMLPPTRLTLGELAGFERVADALAAARGRRIEVVVPGWVDEGAAVRMLLPGDPGYPGDDPGDPEPAP